MMMRCLEAGGIPVAYNLHQEFLNDYYNTSEYPPNPNGFYASPIGYVNDLPLYIGKALKFGYSLLLALPSDINFNILFLKRNPDEIRNSMASFVPNGGHWGKSATILEFYDLVIDSILEKIKSKDNVSLTVLNYAEIVENPTKEFQKLKDNGWDFDVEKAASKVDSSLYRLRLERK